MRARYPDAKGYVERNGVRIFYEVFGAGEQTVLLLPTWSIVHARFWKAQVPYLARHYRAITFDGRGNGRSDRPLDPAAYANDEYVADALALLDASATQRAVLVSLSMGAQWALLLAAGHADRVAGCAFIGPTLPIPPRHEQRVIHSFDDVLETDEGWAKYNRHYWRKDYRGFLEFFFSQCFTEPHSTKQIEDCVGWGLETTPEVLLAIEDAPGGGRSNLSLRGSEQHVRELAGRVRCPVLVIHGDEDAITPHARGAALAEMTGGQLVTLKGGGHIPQARDPVKVNLLLREFVEQARGASDGASMLSQPPRSLIWTRGRNRRRRALYISSPIGLGHAQRDAAIAAALRKLRPDLEIDWLAQHPVTQVLEARGERVHPASALLANESRHIESESAEHDLSCSTPSVTAAPRPSAVSKLPASGNDTSRSARGVWSWRQTRTCARSATSARRCAALLGGREGVQAPRNPLAGRQQVRQSVRLRHGVRIVRRRGQPFGRQAVALPAQRRHFGRCLAALAGVVYLLGIRPLVADAPVQVRHLPVNAGQRVGARVRLLAAPRHFRLNERRVLDERHDGAPHRAV